VRDRLIACTTLPCFKGVVVGRVTFLEDGDHIDCTKMGVGGKAIPALVHKITNVKSDAHFILLVEKDAAFMRLAEDRFYNKFPCIVSGLFPHSRLLSPFAFTCSLSHMCR
jgi:DNA topoisomerase VI subunit A